MPFNASSESEVRRALKQAKLADQQRREILTRVMSTAPGRAWILGWLDMCHVFASSYSGDSHATAFAEGERNIGLRLFNDILAACPDEYVTMMKEGAQRDAGRNRRPRPDPDAPDPSAWGDDDTDDGADTEYDYHGGTRDDRS